MKTQKLESKPLPSKFVNTLIFPSFERKNNESEFFFFLSDQELILSVCNLRVNPEKMPARYFREV